MVLTILYKKITYVDHMVVHFLFVVNVIIWADLVGLELALNLHQIALGSSRYKDQKMWLVVPAYPISMSFDTERVAEKTLKQSSSILCTSVWAGLPNSI